MWNQDIRQHFKVETLQGKVCEIKYTVPWACVTQVTVQILLKFKHMLNKWPMQRPSEGMYSFIREYAKSEHIYKQSHN
jgi:hypothetical protein